MRLSFFNAIGYTMNTDGECPHCHALIRYDDWLVVSDPSLMGCPRCHRALPVEGVYPSIDRINLIASPKLHDQIASMVRNHEDYVVDADGVDARIYMVVNDFSLGVWLCLHHNECDMNKFTRVQRLDQSLGLRQQ